MNRERESFWQEEWAKARLSVAPPPSDRPKFFAIVAYPGASGFLHVGHLRGVVLADVMHRYHRMLGHATFFPTGTHASGLPVVTFAQKIARRDPAIIQQLHDNGVPKREWKKLEDPATAARFLGKSYLRVLRAAGVLVDETADLTTLDDDYQAFIRWQFHRLRDHGALLQAPHFASFCPVCGPVSVDPSETDLDRGGDAEEVQYSTIPFPLNDGRTLLAATLRPETIYGVTNLWVPVQGPLVVWHHDRGTYVVSRKGAERLVEQHGGHLGRELPPEELTGQTVRVPLTGATVPILAGQFVDPSTGSGVVMSVPAHAPVDWLALNELPEEVRKSVPAPPVIIRFPPPEKLTASERALLAGDGAPAERAVRNLGASSFENTGAIEEATERLYRLEYARGEMSIPPHEGIPVSEARELVREVLRKAGFTPDILEFSKPVICRNGHEVIIRKVPDQWFLHYGDPDWKARTRQVAEGMRFFPEEYGRELEGILDWYEDRPCTRRGRWLGTAFPFDPTWIIEPIADSTFYPAYFVVRRYITAERLSADQLTLPFFDFVFLGEGPGEPTVDRSLLEEIRAEFLYWYPLDVNFGGKEHKRVHFPVFLYTHALLLPLELQPRSIFVYWWLTGEGGAKISKKEVSSKGGRIPPIQSALDKWGADALRLFHVTAASPFQDIEWSPGLADTAASRLSETEKLARSLAGPASQGSPELERWLASYLHEVVSSVQTAMESYDLRSVAEAIYVRLPAGLRRYALRGGRPGPATDRALDCWIRLMSPITPHLAEELGIERYPGLVAVQSWPRKEEFAHDPSAVAEEEYLLRVEEDVRAVAALQTEHGEPPRELVLYVAAPWKMEVERWLREWVASGSSGIAVGAVLEWAKHRPELTAYRAEIAHYVPRVLPQLREERSDPRPAVAEVAVLRAADGYLARRFGLEQVMVHQELEAESFDPLGRRSRARPGRPAFYLAGRAATRSPVSSSNS